MNNWELYRLGDFLQFNPKERIAKGEVARKIAMDQLIPYCRDISSNVYEEYKGGAKFRNGDTIMARITPCLENGKTSYVSTLEEDEVAFGSTEYIVLRNIENVSDSKFVYYLSICPQIREVAIKSMVGSSGRQRVQQDVLENYCMNLPSLPTQQKIANILSSLDDKIEANRRINAQLEELAQALFKSWFVDFEPFKDGNFVESELGLIPEGWRVGNLLDVVELFDSLRKPLSGRERDAMEKIYPYYGATSIMDYVDNYIFDGIYLLMGEDGSVINDKEYPYLQYVWGKFWPNNHAHVMQGKNGYTTEMLHVLLSITNVKAVVTGAVQAKISQAGMKRIPVVIAKKGTLDDFSKRISPIYNKIRANSEEITHLSNLRDTLLPKLMSGEIEVNEVKI